MTPPINVMKLPVVPDTAETIQARIDTLKAQIGDC
jgi:hypothetical protein